MIFTRSGLQLATLTSKDVNITDVCWGLAHQTRRALNGQTVHLWTEAQHSLLIGEIAYAKGIRGKDLLRTAFYNAPLAYGLGPEATQTVLEPLGLWGFQCDLAARELAELREVQELITLTVGPTGLPFELPRQVFTKLRGFFQKYSGLPVDSGKPRAMIPVSS